MFILTAQSSWRSLSMISVTWLVLLLCLTTSSARQCTGPQFRPNMSLVPGDSVELDCHLPACPPPSRITWLWSDSPEDVRYPLVYDLPGIFTLVNAMPAAPVVIPVVNRNVEYKVQTSPPSASSMVRIVYVCCCHKKLLRSNLLL